jgi:hypothetical protein
MKGFVLSSLLLVSLLGCASASERPSELVMTLEDIKHRALKELQRNCENDIFWGLQPDYPFVTFTSYNWWISHGGKGPSPTQWCRTYAEWRYGV